MKRLYCFYLLVFLSLFPVSLNSQKKQEEKLPDTRILFIFDASQSMAGYWESDKKINIAIKLLINIIDSLEYLENVKMALRLYGHQSPVPPQNCNDTKLEVPFSDNNAPKIRQKLRYVTPKGTTPIAYALKKGGKDFPPCPCEDGCRNIIILITDGIEACEGDPCQASYELQREGITLKPFVIGIGIDEGFKQTFDCIGNYYNAINEEKFKEVLEVVISQALNATSAQVNLLDIDGNPTESNVNLTLYDMFSGKVKYNYIHTINNKGNPDTLILDHLVTYKMKVHTIPPVEVDNIKLTVGKHTIIAADVPQGSLVLKAKGTNQYRDLEFIIRKSGEMNTLNYHKINLSEKYIVGKYDIEVPILPKLMLYDVEIKQSHTTTIEIQAPGIVTLLKASKGYGSFYVMKGTEQVWIYNINPNTMNESVLLQPGSYRVVFRALNAKQSLYTIVKTFEIKSGSSIPIELF